IRRSVRGLAKRSCAIQSLAVTLGLSATPPTGPAQQSSDSEDFLFLGCKQLVDLGDGSVRRFLYIVGQALLIILGNLVVLFELLDGVEAVAPDVPHRDLCGLGIFVGDLDQFLPPLL